MSSHADPAQRDLPHSEMRFPGAFQMTRCWFCRSDDSMPAFRRSDRIFVLSALFPRLRWYYCRACARHFVGLRRPRAPNPQG